MGVRQRDEGKPDESGVKPQLDLKELDKYARNLGFNSLQALGERILEMPFLRLNTYALEIIIPVFARIQSITQQSLALHRRVIYRSNRHGPRAG